jgi:hypothetical protein
MPLMFQSIWRCSNPNDRNCQNLSGAKSELMNWRVDPVRSAKNSPTSARTHFTSGPIAERDSRDLAPLI